jgi:hypothetical protein
MYGLFKQNVDLAVVVSLFGTIIIHNSDQDLTKDIKKHFNFTNRSSGVMFSSCKLRLTDADY